MTSAAFEPFSPSDLTRNAARPDPMNPWSPIQPVPEGIAEPTRAMLNAFAPAGYALTHGWRYRDGAGRLLGFAVRYDRPANGEVADKQVLPVTFCEHNGRQEWRRRSFIGLRPLYALDLLAARRSAPVLVVEGEKAADAAAKRFTDYVVTTSSGGSNAARKADWSPLSGRRVVIWRDADEPGEKYAADVAECCERIGALEVRRVVLPKSLPVGWDLADDLPGGVSEADLVAALEAANTTAGWPAPLPIVTVLPRVEPFEPDALLPTELRDYVVDVALRQQSSPDFAAVAALCGLAAVVGNKVRIAPKQNDDWTVVPNLWGAIVGRPSAMKSPAMQSALAPLYALQDDLRKEWEETCKDLAADDELSSLDTKAAKKSAEKALKGGDRDEARRLLREAQGEDAEPRPCPRLIVNDATVEKLGELLNENPNGLLLIRDELPGFLSRLEAEEYQSDRAFYLESFNGDGSFTYDRIGRGTVHIRNATQSIIGGVQPSRIAPIVRGAISGSSNDGLIQRLQMAVWPDDIAEWKWVDRRPDPQAKEIFEGVFRQLHDIPAGAEGEPLVLRFTAKAQDAFREWVTEINTDARSGVLSSVMESHLLKMPKTIAGLALLFELIAGGRTSVGEAATLRALEWADYLRTHADRLYAAGQTLVEDGARLIVERRAQLPEQFTPRDIQRKAWAGLADRDAVTSAIETLLATHHCREVPQDGPAGRGRPSVAYAWNPAMTVEV